MIGEPELLAKDEVVLLATITGMLFEAELAVLLEVINVIPALLTTNVFWFVFVTFDALFCILSNVVFKPALIVAAYAIDLITLSLLLTLALPLLIPFKL